MNDYQTYRPDGKWNFVYTGNKENRFLDCVVNEYPDAMLDFYEKDIIGELMSGEEFYEQVDCGGIRDSDGVVSNVFVFGYDSNLGLFHKGLCQGGFLVDGPTWLELCKLYNIEVEWVNWRIDIL